MRSRAALVRGDSRSSPAHSATRTRRRLTAPSTSCRSSAIFWARIRRASRSSSTTPRCRAATCSSSATFSGRSADFATTATTTTGISACAPRRPRSRSSSSGRSTSIASTRPIRSQSRRPARRRMPIACSATSSPARSQTSPADATISVRAAARTARCYCDSSFAAARARWCRRYCCGHWPTRGVRRRSLRALPPARRRRRSACARRRWSCSACTEAVLDLDVRAMRQLGGDWCRVNFTLPGAGEFVDEFVADACALLATEYEGRDLIALKDPRICVLAPLWHRALAAAGYRPTYVVTVRNPLEVAQSLHARGDMSIDEGLELWRTHMERVAAFADAHADVVFARYTDLLDDWQRVVGRIAARLDVPLDTGGNVDEVQRFLDKGLRNQAAGDDALDARLAGPSGEAIRALYRDCLARCDDAPTSPSSVHASRCAEEERAGRGNETPATACFVLCIENNAIREQA